jgi:hypothetical protein
MTGMGTETAYAAPPMDPPLPPAVTQSRAGHRERRALPYLDGMGPVADMSNPVPGLGPKVAAARSGLVLSRFGKPKA